MPAQSTGKVLYAGLNVPNQAVSSELCRAHKEAVKDWCATPKKKRKGKFNDYFFDKLKQKGPLADLEREVPLGVITEAGDVLNLKAASKLAGDLGQGATEALQRMDELGEITENFDAARGGRAASIKAIFKRNDAPIEKTLFPDAMTSDGTAIEVKGPGDGPNPKGQPENYADISPKKRCIVVDCQHCNSPCKDKHCAD